MKITQQRLEQRYIDVLLETRPNTVLSLSHSAFFFSLSLSVFLFCLHLSPTRVYEWCRWHDTVLTYARIFLVQPHPYTSTTATLTLPLLSARFARLYMLSPAIGAKLFGGAVWSRGRWQHRQIPQYFGER